MSETFVISDTHFGHVNSLTFKRSDGSPLRPFSNVDEMDEFIVNKWNEVVRPVDKVIHLGDVVMHPRNLHILNRLNGKKKLIAGNHDEADYSVYSEYFYDIKSYRQFDTCGFSHVPLHPGSLERWSANIHGHLHSNYVMGVHNQNKRDYRYFNCSVDCDDMNWQPMPWYRVKEILKSRGVVLQSKRSGKVIL